jgi:hypothetical protein
MLIHSVITPYGPLKNARQKEGGIRNFTFPTNFRKEKERTKITISIHLW